MYLEQHVSNLTVSSSGLRMTQYGSKHVVLNIQNLMKIWCV